MAILLFADPDYPVTDEHHRYWAELGRFIHRFAMLEQQIHFLLRLYAETPIEIAQAVFSGVRSKGAIDQINRLREVKGLPENADFKRAVDQFGVINGTRDAIVHSGAILHPHGFLVSNKMRTLPRQQRTFPVSPESLAKMTDDLQTIFAAMFVMQCEADGGDISNYQTDFRELSRAPWKYKSPAQDSRPHTYRDATLRHAIQLSSLGQKPPQS